MVVLGGEAECGGGGCRGKDWDGGETRKSGTRDKLCGADWIAQPRDWSELETKKGKELQLTPVNLLAYTPNKFARTVWQQRAWRSKI